MSSAIETAAVQNAAAASTKTTDAEVDGDAFMAELAAQLAEGDGEDTSAKASGALARLTRSLSSYTFSQTSKTSASEDVTYYLTANESANVTLSEEMLGQMADDEEMFSKVQDMISGLFSASNSQSLTASSKSTNLWKSITIDTTETKYVEVSRNANGSTSLASLALSTQEIVDSALDLLMDSHQTSRNSGGTQAGSLAEYLNSISSGTSSGTASGKSSGFNNLVTNTTSWNFQIAFSSTSTAQQALEAQQAQLARLDIMIEQISTGSFSGSDLFSYMQIMGLSDPLVFDLTGDGINLTSSENGVLFDIKGDGSPTQTAWITPGNAFLYLDENGNQIVDDANELFGDHAGHANGFEKLAQYDDNGDGVIDSNDEVYSKLRLWQDLNSDGVNQESESLTLAQAGIASINLNHDNSQTLDKYGNVITDRSSYTRTDGTTGEVADAWLKSARV